VVGLEIGWGAWALARFCAPWARDAGEKEKNALPRKRKVFVLRRFGTRGRSRLPAKAFFSFSPGNSVGGASRPALHRLESLCHRTSVVRVRLPRAETARLQLDGNRAGGDVKKQ